VRGRLLAGALLLTATCLAAVPSAFAGNSPPPPPPTPNCGSCSGPPPPPTRVPTLAPTSVPQPTVVVSISLSPVRVRRGKAIKLSVMASAGNAVTASIQYRRGKPVTYRGKVDAGGQYMKAWTVPKTAPLGKAQVKVAIQRMEKSQPPAVDFVVLK
jgi:hypothetical protein